MNCTKIIMLAQNTYATVLVNNSFSVIPNRQDATPNMKMNTPKNTWILR